MDKSNKERKPLRMVFTKTVNKINELLSSENPDETLLQGYLETLKECYEKIEYLDLQVVAQLIEEEVKDDIIDLEYTEIKEYKLQFKCTKIKINKLLYKQDECGSKSVSHVSNVSQINGDENSRVNEVSSKVTKYPKVTIKKFDGDLREWLGFWAQFNNIHKDNSLPTSYKFQCLVQSMVKGSKAQILVCSYPQSDENYPKVIEALQKRFGKRELLVEVYFRELLKLVITNNTNKSVSLKLSSMYDTLESHLRALESLNINSDKYDCMLYPMVESSLPDEVLRAWQRSMLFINSGKDKSKLATLMEFLRNEVESEEKISLAKDGFGLSSKASPRRKQDEISNQEGLSTAAGLHVSSSKISIKCLFCNGNHDTDRCVKAQTMSFSEKKQKISSKKVCFVCFTPGHVARACKAVIRCNICGRKHYVVMCPDAPDNKQKSKTEKESAVSDAEPNSPKEAETNVSMSCNGGHILLQTILVNAIGTCGKKIVRLMLDSGAQRSYISDNSVADLGAQVVGQEHLDQITFGGTKSGPMKHSLYNITLEDLTGKNKLNIQVLNQKVICGEIPKLQKGPWLKELSIKGIWINDMDPKYNKIDILIGADFYGQIMTGRSCRLDNGVLAFETIFGWTLLGKMDVEPSVAWTVTNLLVSVASVTDLWSLETIGILDPAESLSKAEKEEYSNEHFKKTVKINIEGRYEIELPWIVDKGMLHSNKNVAMRRLTSLTQRLSTDQKAQYNQVFSEWLADNLIEEVPEREYNLPCHYLPHRPVFKPSSETTPVRPVFDASCKIETSFSLNDCLEKGANLIETLPAIILRFRERRIGVTSDIRKAFMMISVNPQDRDFLRFLWCNEDGSIREFRHTRVVFGLNCSPYILGAVIRKHLDSTTEPFKTTAEILRKGLYVDNCVTSVDTVDNLIKFKTEAVELMCQAKMDLRCWEHSGLNDVHNSKLELSEVTQKMEGQVSSSITDVLGLQWNRITDSLACNIPEVEESSKGTKRTVLSIVQRFFDPMGYLCPATLPPKLLLQEAWIRKLGWDSELPESLQQKFKSWLSEVSLLSQIKVPRWMTAEGSEYDSWELHIFCDASQSAFAAAVFLRSNTSCGCEVQLLQAKTRVAPIPVKKRVSIPRLELMACVIGVRLAESIKKALDIKHVRSVYWSDSTTALSWIQRDQVWNTFVRNRVSEILKFSNRDRWKYVPSACNPADLPSRGCGPPKLIDSRWWEGPKWLREPEHCWPNEVFQVDEQSIKEEISKSKKTNVNLLTCRERPWYGQRFNTYSRNLRVIAWILRFSNNARRTTRTSGELSASEINIAEQKLVWIIQQECFTKSKHFNNLSTIVDNDGLIRVETKITRRNDPYDFRYPYLLPSNHFMVDALVEELHKRNCHAGVQVLMTKIRERFWILRSRKIISRVKAKCMICKRHEQRPFVSHSVSLPKDRVEEATSFQITGVDLAGPLYLKDNSKVWIVLFTCAVYRAVHLELVSSLSTASFLQSLRRFIARRGRPSVIYSDNGTNFVGCDNMFRAIDWKLVTSKFAVDRIEWKFSPPTAAWWGGWWERLIRVVKQLLIRMLGRALLDYEELSTVLCDVEAVVNSRPLTYVSEDSQDLIPLTPSMFLQDTRTNEMYDLDEIERVGFEKRYRYRQRLREDFRQRFRKEYLAQLVQKRKEVNEDVKIGDVVLIDIGDKRRLQWPLGRVVDVYPGQDGYIRVVRLKTSTGEIVRPIQRIYLMESKSSIDLPERRPEERREDEELTTAAEDDRNKEEVVTRSGRTVKPPKKYDD